MKVGGRPLLKGPSGLLEGFCRGNTRRGITEKTTLAIRVRGPSVTDPTRVVFYESILLKRGEENFNSIPKPLPKPRFWRECNGR